MYPRVTISTNNKDPAKINHPEPNDFDHFLPWACREFSNDFDVVVTRTVQQSYVSAIAKKRKTSLKLKKQSSPIQFGSGNDMNMSSIFDKPLNTENIIMIETVYDINENLVQLKFLKNKAIPRAVIQTIALTIPYQPYLTSITINSGLRMDSLYEISKILPHSYITELCLDGTFIREANYHILLTDSKIKHLSLAKCTIMDAVVKTIADKLIYPCPASKVLSTLNLSSNRIKDVGAKYLADMLRTNRQLRYLNLADNMLTDEGGMNILDTLHEFPLHAQELFESGARYAAYLKQKNNLINNRIIEELPTAKLDKIPKQMLKKSNWEIHSQQPVAFEIPLIETGVDAQTIRERAKNLADRKIGLFYEPFSLNNTKIQDGVVYCFGNNTLCYLNVAYNNLTYASVKKLHEVLSTQLSLNRTPRGLIKVVIEGNLMPVACKEYEEIDRLLESGLGSLTTKKRGNPVMKKEPTTTKTSL